MSLYQYSVKDIKKNEVSLKDYEGKVLLVVNTASGCGFTPQYEGLENLYKQYKDSGFEILDFPCNQFMNQAPGSDEELASFCQMKFGTTFKTFAKVNVNGDDADPLFKYLRTEAPHEHEDEKANSFKKVLNDLKQTFTGDSVKWNFTKFLVDRNGKVIARFAPTVKPEDLTSFIEKVL
ncbi:MAG TPA: glutathione peroxidase [Erysipelotrichaceae bacterium]|nr:glutathione peroxidase [Erysipelotrichaceae bacterium]